MAIRFIRKPSDTPNISNADDTRILRYAFGDYNGYIKGKGAELSYSINGSIFKINSGIIILQGYDVEIDANGWELAVDNVATKRYFSVYLEVNLATQTADIKSMYNTAGYPTIAVGDDLTTSSTGTARLLLYTFTGQSGVVAEVSKKVEVIKYSSEHLKTISDQIAIIQEQLNINYGNITLSVSGTVTENWFKKQANFVIFMGGKLHLDYPPDGTIIYDIKQIGTINIPLNNFTLKQYIPLFDPTYLIKLIFKNDGSVWIDASNGVPSIFINSDFGNFELEIPYGIDLN